MEFEEFIKRLPTVEPAKRSPLISGTTPLTFVETAIPNFVAPDLSDSSELSSTGAENPSDASIAIISASGAVGKTVLANQIAYRTGSPLFDLSKFGAVGKHSLHGAVQHSFGWVGAGAFMDGLTRGDVALVIDALDEARVKVSEAAFHDFLSDLTAAGKGATRPVIILLGRAGVAETAWLVLESAGTRVSLFTIDYFSKDKAEEYVRLHARDAFSKHPDKSSQVLQLIFDRVTKAAKSSEEGGVDEARFLLGYAPVLNAIAKIFEEEPNLAALASKLARPSQATEGFAAGVEVLADVIEHILDREHDKIQINVVPTLRPVAPSWTQWDSLYSPREQCGRLCRLLLDGAFDISQMLPSMPPSLEADYEDRIASFLPDHAFVRGQKPANSVFEAFLHAWALREGSSIPQLADAVREYLRSPLHKPAPLLAEFYFRKAATGQLVVPPENIGHLYDSVTALEGDKLFVEFEMDGGTSDDFEDDGTGAPATADVEIRLTPEGHAPRLISFVVPISRNSDVIFQRGLRNCSITLPCTLQLVPTGADIKLQGNVSVDVERLVISGPLVVTKTLLSQPGDRVLLTARHCDAKSLQPPLVWGGTQFHVSFPGAEKYPWRPYRFEITAPPKWSQPERKAYLRLHKIIRIFQSHRRGQPARYAGKLQHRRVLKDYLGEMMLEQLVRDGILNLRGDFYYLDADNMARLTGASWVDIDLQRVPPRLAEYIASFVDKNRSLFRN